MSKAPNDVADKSEPNDPAQDCIPNNQTKQITSGETVYDKFTKAASKNPKFVEVKNADKGFVIAGGKP